MRLLVVGTRFFPYPHAGDKTFWFAALKSIASEGDEVRVVSIDTRSAPVSPILPGLEWMRLAAIPVFLGGGPHRERYNPSQREIGAITNYASKSITMPRLFSLLKGQARRWAPDVVHFMDNLGPATFPYLLGFRPPACVSAVTYDPKSALYDLALRWSLEGFDMVAASSDAFRGRLSELGIRVDRLRTVRWGVDPEPPLSGERRREKKRELGFDPDLPLLLWSGFLQQTTVEDFRLALAAVKGAARSGARFSALFCFKPQHYRDAYLPESGDAVEVSGAPERFLAARSCADLFLNPVTRMGSILAPPLTWVEVLARGVPILTTECGGVDEVLGRGLAGRAAPPEELGPALTELLERPDRLGDLGEGARRWAEKQFSLAGAVRGLRALWRSAGAA